MGFIPALTVANLIDGHGFATDAYVGRGMIRRFGGDKPRRYIHEGLLSLDTLVRRLAHNYWNHILI
ncbi:hypothetical protein D1AOALGA4SA_12895 [Olavius algarvensis Delta 1 endosymbiont]|nr:hypothetical protein D1AOALGA4SA_12895 [Olavius algarvensis Delta 1 endosymbiont]